VMSLAPIFVAFLITHAILIFGGIFLHMRDVSGVYHSVSAGFTEGHAKLGLAGMALLFARAYSMGAGTYTGIEAISNGVALMRDPKVQTAKRTMVYMAFSLAITAGGILLLYLLVNVRPIDDETPLNAILCDRITKGIPGGFIFVVLTVGSEVALLFVA